MKKRKAQLIGIATVLFAFLFPAAALAATLTHSVEIPSRKTNWIQSLSIPKLPSASGSLTAITFTLESAIEGNLKVESVDSAASEVTSSLAAEITLKRPDGTVILMHSPGESKTDSFAIYDGIVDYAGISGAMYDIASASSGSVTIEPVSEGDSALFRGDGTVNLPLSAEGVSGFEGAGNLQSESTLFASTKTTITYTYATPDLAISSRVQEAFILGRQGTILLTVQNIGSATTSNSITVLDSVPAGLSLISASGNGWSCSIDGKNITCTSQGPLAAGESLSPISLVTNVTSAALPNVINTASVQTEGDTDERNGGNTTSMTISVSVESSGGNEGDGNNNGNGNNGGGATGGEDTGTTNNTVSNDLVEGAFGGGEEDEGIDAQGCEIPFRYTEALDVAALNGCFEYVPDRAITFTDLKNHPARNYINALKNTSIRGQGDFIFSGAGNHSSGKQQGEYQSGSYPFEPSREPTRLEVVKIALIANCIPIDESINPSGTSFYDVPKDATEDAQSFIAHIFYTAARYDIAKGYPDGSAKPHSHANNAEILALLLRAADVLPIGFTAREGTEWYEEYLEFARANHLVDSSFNPGGHMDRGTLGALLVNVMALHPDPSISSYIAKLDIDEGKTEPLEMFYLPLPQTGELMPMEGLSCEELDPRVNSCLGYDPERRLRFRDVPLHAASFKAIDALKRTYIRASGDYIFSGTGNHSTGGQEAGTWEFQPDRIATRFEVVKTALVSNCIPILSFIPDTEITFTDIPKEFTGDAAQDLVTRVFYTAAFYDIVEGNTDGSAAPNKTANTIETLAILLRTANAIPDGFTANNFSIDGLSSTSWYAPYVSFAIRNGLEIGNFTESITRANLAELLADIMRFSYEDGIRSFRTSIDALIH